MLNGKPHFQSNPCVGIGSIIRATMTQALTPKVMTCCIMSRDEGVIVVPLWRLVAPYLYHAVPVSVL